MKYLSPSKTAAKCQPSAQSRSGDKKGGARQRNKHFERGIADLAIEARFLSVLRHENIIELHGVSEGSLESLFNCAEDEKSLIGRRRSSYRHRFGYFLLLDPLYETLATRCERRYLRDVLEPPAPPSPPPSSSGGRGSRRGDGERPWFRRLVGGGVKVGGLSASQRQTHGLPIEAWREGLADRLEAVRGVADALRYLHDDCRIVFRGEFGLPGNADSCLTALQLTSNFSLLSFVKTSNPTTLASTDAPTRRVPAAPRPATAAAATPRYPSSSTSD